MTTEYNNNLPSNDNIINEFHQTMAECGIYCNTQIIQDGNIHRFANNGKGKKNGWYVLHEYGGAFGDWKQGSKHYYSAYKNSKLTPHQKVMIDMKMQAERIKHKQLSLNQQEQTALQAQGIMSSGSNIGDSLYLTNKQVGAFGIKFHREYIAVPLVDINGKLWNVQRIYANGKKFFLKNGKVEGCFHIMGNLKHIHNINICEGYATGSSIYIATNNTVVVCFSSGSIEHVVKQFRQRFPKLAITIAADNDVWGDYNTGKEKAELVAKKYSCRVAIPCFASNNKELV